MKSQKNNSKRVANYFDNNWDRYQEAVRNNVLYHVEMFSAVEELLNNRFKKGFTLADLGCGDGSAILPIVKDKPIKRYIGIDAASGLLEKAREVLSELHCEKQFICEDMGLGIKKLDNHIEVILSSYALHHLSHDDKIIFIQNCYDKLNQDGCFILIDGVLEPNQDRDTWLMNLEKQVLKAIPNITQAEADKLLEHPRKDDFPESISTFKNIAEMQNWKKFEVLIDKGMYAFMVFTKNN